MIQLREPLWRWTISPAPANHAPAWWHPRQQLKKMADFIVPSPVPMGMLALKAVAQAATAADQHPTPNWMCAWGIADLTGLVCSNALLVWIFVRKVNSCNHTEHGSGGASRGWLSFWLSWNRISSRQLPPSPCEPVPLLHGQRPSRFPVRWWSVWWVPAMSPCPDRHRFPEKPPRDGISARLKDGGWSWLKCGGSFQVQQDCLSEGWSLTQYSRHSWNHGGTTEVRIRDRKNQTDVTNFASNFRSLWGRKPSFNRTSWCLEIL